MATMRLSDLARGVCAKIVDIGNDAQEALSEKRLRHIGFEEDKEVEILHTGPFGRDPIAVRVENVTLAIRRDDASLIKVKAA